jgi:glycine cleavage system H protein
MRKYTEDHEWLEPEGEAVRVGITEYATIQLGDIVFIELPEVGRTVEKGDEVCVIESVKAASDIAAPLAGEIVAVNEKIAEEPKLVNDDPLSAGWFFTIKPAEGAGLDAFMDEDAYKKLTE